MILCVCWVFCQPEYSHVIVVIRWASWSWRAYSGFSHTSGTLVNKARKLGCLSPHGLLSFSHLAQLLYILAMFQKGGNGDYRSLKV